MTAAEFDKAKFTGQMKCEYKGKIYFIISVDFEERLIAIYENPAMEYEENAFPDWKRCENVTLIK